MTDSERIAALEADVANLMQQVEVLVEKSIMTTDLLQAALKRLRDLEWWPNWVAKN